MGIMFGEILKLDRRVLLLKRLNYSHPQLYIILKNIFLDLLKISEGVSLLT